jgi:protein TonB
MATLTFDTVSAPPRRKTARRLPARPVAFPVPTVEATARRVSIKTVVLVGAIVALHAGAVISLSGARRTVAAPAAVPITISLAPPPKVEPPPPPPKPQPPRPRAVTSPRPAAAPVVAADTPLVAASFDTVQVARAPVEAAPEPVPAAPKAEEPVTEPKGYAGYLRNPAPDYPAAAQKRGLEGKVVLKVHVLASGQPDNVSVAKSSGHQILDDAALKAVTQWAFAPARRGQTAIDGWVQVPLTFKI